MLWRLGPTAATIVSEILELIHICVGRRLGLILGSIRESSGLELVELDVELETCILVALGVMFAPVFDTAEGSLGQVDDAVIFMTHSDAVDAVSGRYSVIHEVAFIDPPLHVRQREDVALEVAEDDGASGLDPAGKIQVISSLEEGLLHDKALTGKGSADLESEATLHLMAIRQREVLALKLHHGSLRRSILPLTTYRLTT